MLENKLDPLQYRVEGVGWGWASGSEFKSQLSHCNLKSGHCDTLHMLWTTTPIHHGQGSRIVDALYIRRVWWCYLCLSNLWSSDHMNRWEAMLMWKEMTQGIESMSSLVIWCGLVVSPQGSGDDICINMGGNGRFTWNQYIGPQPKWPLLLRIIIHKGC